jgi:1-acyl-sn-glycerol-3-phosphate acyltransferase
MTHPLPEPCGAAPGPGRPRGWPAAARRRVTALRQFLLFYLLLLCFAVMCLAWSLPASLLARLLPPAAGQPLGQRAIGLGFRMFLGMLRRTGLLQCDFSALDSLRDDAGIVIAPNHPSLLDAVLVASRLPRVVCIAKSSIWHNPLLGGGMRLAGYVRNDAPLPMIRHAIQAIHQGRQLLIFPEGTRSPARDGACEHLGPFSRSFALIAQGAGAPVQTLLIECESTYLRKGVSLLRQPALPLRYRVRLGQRFEPDGDARGISERVERHLRGRLAGAPGPQGRCAG